MKKFLLISGAALFMVACNQVPDQVAGTSASNYIQQQVQPVPDTAGLASFQAWKAQNELADIQEFQSQKALASAPVKRQAAKATPLKRSTPKTQKSSSPSQSTASNNESNAGSGTMNNESSGTAQAEKKEGWSKAAKGAVIGGVAGAAGGAVINKKNRVVGAVVGAVIGAGGGYVIGRKMDKKDGRIEYSLQ